MSKETITQHVALQYNNKKQADVFFKEILDLDFIKEFKLSEELAKQIFNTSEETDVVVYGNEKCVFEIFITHNKTEYIFNHVCIEVYNKDNFVKKCKENKLKPFFVDKGDKKLLFVKDYSDNLYEIK